MPRHMVVGFPAVRGLEFCLGEDRSHVDIVEPTLHELAASEDGTGVRRTAGIAVVSSRANAARA